MTKEVSGETTFTIPMFLGLFPAEKSAAIVAELGNMTQGNIEAFTRSVQIVNEGAVSIGRDAYTLYKTSADKFRMTVKELTSLRSPAELLTSQVTHTRSLTEEILKGWASLGQTTAALMKEAGAPLLERYTLASKTLESAASN